MQRRTFLLGSGLALAARGANRKVNHAIVGLGGRGRDHIKSFAPLPDCHIGALCDVDTAQTERAVQLVQAAQGHQPKTYRDMRQLFEDKSIDSVSIVTPNHWHALATVWAVQAGKDVYCEKPACHNIFEGQQMIAAARKYNRMVQIGSQSRSIAHKRKAIQLLHEGVIGDIYLARGLCFKRRLSIGHTPEQPVPAGVDWDMFLGPAPSRPYSRNRHVYNWHWFWDTGNGDIGNQGVHEMDLARWGLNRNTLPASVSSTGGKYLYQDDQETPNTQLASFDYGNAELVFEVRGLPTNGEDGVPLRGPHAIGNIFCGSKGIMTLDLNGYQVFLGDKREPGPSGKFEEKQEWDSGPHMANFIAAAQSRRVSDLHADIAEGVLSANLVHVANISHRLKRRLAIDPQAQNFPGDSAANELLTRNYREPYVVPRIS